MASLQIARHKDVQERLRTEIKELEGKFDFESMESLQYLDQVVYGNGPFWNSSVAKK